MNNKYKCPIKIWRKMSDNQKEIYNDFTEKTINDKSVLCPFTIGQYEWEVIVHNMACKAAWISAKIEAT